MGKAKLTIGQFLQSVRNERGFPVTEVAKKIGVTRQAVYNWEHGSKISLPSLIALVSAYSMTQEEIDRLESLGYKVQSQHQVLAAQREIEIFSGWVVLPEESRKRILRAMTAYDSH